jgi:hypothetical protein
MYVQLTKQEKLFVDNFLEQCKNTKDESWLKYMISFVFFSSIGLFMIVYTSILTLNNMVDRVIKWVLFPGTISGVLLILTGYFIWQYHKKIMEKQKLANIIQKLM